MTELFAVYGAGGFGREVMPLLRQTLSRQGEHVTPHSVLFIDDHPKARELNGHAVVTVDDFLRLPGEKHVAIAIADSRIRERAAVRCREAGLGFIDVQADSSLLLDGSSMGEGSILCGFSHVTSNAKIGRQFHANYYSYVAHDCIVGDFVTLAPAAKVNGAVILEDHVYIGAGAVIRQGNADRPMVIGRGAVVGMGAVVTKSVAPGATVVGNPARPLGR